MIHTTLTVYSAEGVMVLVIVYTLGIALIVFYLKWLRANAELKKLRHPREDRWEARNMNPTVDRRPISFGQIEPSSNACDAAAPITAPPIKLSRIPLTLAGIVKNKVSKVRAWSQSIKSGTFEIFGISSAFVNKFEKRAIRLSPLNLEMLSVDSAMIFRSSLQVPIYLDEATNAWPSFSDCQLHYFLFGLVSLS